MGLFGRSERGGKEEPHPSYLDTARAVFREEKIDIDPATIPAFQTAPEIQMLMCERQCSHDFILYIGQDPPASCPACGQPLKPFPHQVDWGNLPEVRQSIAAQGHYHDALARVRRNDIQGAEMAFSRALGIMPDFQDALYNRAEARIALGDHEGGIADCSKVIALNPDAYDAYLTRGAARASNGDFAGCIEDTGKAIATGSTNPIAFFNRGVSYFRLGMPAEARRDLLRFRSEADDEARMPVVEQILSALE